MKRLIKTPIGNVTIAANRKSIVDTPKDKIETIKVSFFGVFKKYTIKHAKIETIKNILIGGIYILSIYMIGKKGIKKINK